MLQFAEPSITGEIKRHSRDKRWQAAARLGLSQMYVSRLQARALARLLPPPASALHSFNVGWGTRAFRPPFSDSRAPAG